MGTSKARLVWNGRPLALALAAAIAPAVARVWLVAKPGAGLDDLGLPVLRDQVEEPALVHGIAVALGAPGPEWRWLVACDMPGVDAAVLHGLFRAAQAAGAPGSYVQRPDRTGLEPLPSLWHRDVASQVRPAWGLAARDWVAHAGLVAWHVPESGIERFANVNTPAEWEEWQWRSRPGNA
jgi:molybdopterin-guanine dinucleotide biosynthesis protein A